jgi:hypothetical protein
MATEKFKVRNRWSGAVQFTAEIECSPNELPRIKLGLAVRWAYRNGADLSGADLRGADLRDAVLRGADLRDAVLRGAVLSDADLSGAVLRDAVLSGKKVARILASVNRVCGGYTFNLFEMQEGAPLIAAGCRLMTLPDYRAHVAAEYPDSAKARETLRILDYFDVTVAAEVVARPVEVAA